MILYIIIAVLFILFIQDFSGRSIHISLPPLLFGLLYWYNREEITTTDLIFNLGFISLVIGLLFIYISLRTKKLTNPFKRHFGLGDLLFLFSISPIDKTYNFMFIFIIGTLFTVILHTLVQIFQTTSTIPYAGYFSIFIILLLLYPIDFEKSLQLN